MTQQTTPPKLVECPFCKNPPRYLAAKTGYYTERVICDHCNFHLEETHDKTAPERWNASQLPTRSHEESRHLQDLKNALDQCVELRQQLQLAVDHRDGNCWIWDPKEQNGLESMGNRMAVLIYACDLRELLAGATKTPLDVRLCTIEDCRDMFTNASVSWNLLNDKLKAETDGEVNTTDPQPYLWVSPEQAANITDHPPGEGGRYLPVRKSRDGKFTEPLYQRRPPSKSYLRERAQLEAEWVALRDLQRVYKEGTWLRADEIQAMIRQLDVLLNGEAGAAKQGTLSDLVSQVRRIVKDRGETPLLLDL